MYYQAAADRKYGNEFETPNAVSADLCGVATPARTVWGQRLQSCRTVGVTVPTREGKADGPIGVKGQHVGDQRSSQPFAMGSSVNPTRSGTSGGDAFRDLRYRTSAVFDGMGRFGKDAPTTHRAPRVQRRSGCRCAISKLSRPVTSRPKRCHSRHGRKCLRRGGVIASRL